PFPPALAFPKPAATRSPWRAASKDLAAQLFAAGSRSERHASGPERTGHSSHRPGAARRRSAPQLLAAPATDPRPRAGLIDQSTQPFGDGFPIRLSSTRTSGPLPAALT